jgi:hypothetical protein
LLDDYEVIAARAFDEPYLGELRDHVRVCGDHFESHGDPRGTLIALGEARYDATGVRARELQREIDQHVVTFHESELGTAARLFAKPRTCVVEWRCGRMYAAHLDTRYAAPDGRERGNLAYDLLRAPAARWLRRLTIRIRQDVDLDAVLGWIRAVDPRPPLEELLVLREVRPRRLDYRQSAALTLASLYPRLYLYAQLDAIIAIQPMENRDGTRLLPHIHAVAAPLDVHGRTLLGRALQSPEPGVREAALQQVALLGDHAEVFVDLLARLLQPQIGMTQLPILACLAAIGPVARRALPVLVKMPGRTRHYDQDTRRAAGRLVASLR